jgi:preprotein translocase subunit Sec63
MFKLNSFSSLKISRINIFKRKFDKVLLSTFSTTTKNQKDYYSILEIPRNATEDQIKKAYRNLGNKTYFI